MTGVIDQVKTWREKKPPDVVKDVVTDAGPKFEDVKPRKEVPKYTKDVGAETGIFNLINAMNMNKANGHWILSNPKHRKDFYWTVRVLMVNMEILKPDDEYRADIIKSTREPDITEETFAMWTACMKLLNRANMAPPKKGDITDYKPDVKKFESREFEDD